MIVELGGKWATKKGALLAHTINDSKKYVPLPFEVARNSIATYVGRDGLIKTAGVDEARIDFSKGPEGALLTEPQSTNAITQSQDFSTNWLIEGSGTNQLIPNTTIAPDGTLTADTFETTGTGVGNLAQQTATATGSKTFTLSIWMRSLTGSFDNFQFHIKDGTTGTDQNSGNFSITDKWVRYEYTATFVGGVNNARPYIRQANNSIQVAVWGAQLEEFDYPTSYIPTEGATVTRLADSVIDCGNEFVFNSEEGVLYVEISALADGLIAKNIALSDGGFNDRLSVGYDTISNRISALSKVGGVTEFNVGFVVSDTKEFHKVAINYKQNSVSMWVDGVLIQTQNVNTWISNTLNSLHFNNGGGTSFFEGDTKALKVFPTALTNVELTRLTTNGYL